MEIDTQNIDREIIETREKQQSLHSEKGRDMQDSNHWKARTPYDGFDEETIPS